MTSAKHLILFAFVGSLGLAVAAPLRAQVDSSLEELMSQDQFERAGLNKLSAEELAFLNRWIRERKAMPAPAAPVAPAAAAASADNTTAPAASDSSAGFRPKAAKREKIVSQIDGEFSGWSGKTRFKLKNGQVWRQIDDRSFPHSAFEPKVEIRPKAAGSWRMYVDGINRSVKVVRIK